MLLNHMDTIGLVLITYLNGWIATNKIRLNILFYFVAII